MIKTKLETMDLYTLITRAHNETTRLWQEAEERAAKEKYRNELLNDKGQKLWEQTQELAELLETIN